MLLCDLTLDTCAANLACDEALLDHAEETASGPLLRFWSPREICVVVGYANSVATEVDLHACARSKVPVFRRCTGGGTVVQAPGCLNYSLILPIASHTDLSSITRTNGYVMGRIRNALAPLVKEQICIEGHTDLAINKVKFCGNAQRRRKDYLIFHGCFLLHCELALIDALLPMPSKEPAYRQGRSHSAFIRNLHVSEQDVKDALVREWDARTKLVAIPYARISELAATRYSKDEWNLRI